MSKTQDMTLSEATRLFISQIPDEERSVYQQELSRFLRWYGRERLLQDITPPQVDDYIQEVQKAGGDYHTRLLPLRSFLSFARDKGYTASNLGTIIKLKRSGGRKAEAAQANAKKPEETHYLTPEGYRKLQDELASLKSRRPDLAMELRLAAADKDMRENAPYDAAKDKQGKVEARIRELERALNQSVIMTGSPDSAARVQQGHKVVVRDMITGEELHYTLVNPREVDLMAGKISFASPMGRALLERTVGDKVQVVAPQGTLHYQILHVE